MDTLWSGRFQGRPDAGTFAFGRSFGFDRRLFEDDVQGSLAWAEALSAAGVISASDWKAIDEGLRGILDEGLRTPSFVDGPDEDVHTFVERVLVARVGDAGRRLHTGRSRNEQVALDLRLYVRRRLPVQQRGVVGVVEALVAQAERAGDLVMPGYTHLRRAQPVLMAHFWLAHAAALMRDHERLGAVRDEAGVLPLGSGALAGTAYPIDTAALAARLGFPRVAANSLDAVADRDFVAAYLLAGSLVLVHLSRLAEDLIVFGSEEFGFIELDDRVTTGSSLMPQKKNPDPLELVRGKAGRIIGRLTGWLATVKGLPSGYNKDLQEDKEAVFDAEDTVLGCLEASAVVVGTLTVDRRRLAGATGGTMIATDVADFLVARGMPFRTAHEVVARLVDRMLAEGEGRGFAQLSMREWREASELFDESVVEWVSARASVERRQTPQSTGPAHVRSALASARTWLDTVHEP